MRETQIHYIEQKSQIKEYTLLGSIYVKVKKQQN